MVSFKNLDFRVDARRSAPVGALSDNMPHTLLKPHINYWDVIPVSWRSSVVRVVFMKLAATGILCALVSGYSDNNDVSWCCTLAAAVNFIACTHYGIVWAIRAQALPSAFSHLLLGRTNTGNVIPVGPQQPESASSRATETEQPENIAPPVTVPLIANSDNGDRTKALLYAQENAVDSLRFSDWLVT